MYFSFRRVSTNQKTGPMPSTMASKGTCPDSCPLKDNGCYAENAPMVWHWEKIQGSFKDMITSIRRLPRGLMWRYGQAGDLPGEGDEIDREQFLELAKANQRRPVLCYTHKPISEHNLTTLKMGAKIGFNVNLSANGLKEVDSLVATGLPVVTLLPFEYQKTKKETLSQFRDRVRKLPLVTKGGSKIAICPATYMETTCIDCGVCADPIRSKVVIGFPAHGTKRRIADTIAKGRSNYGKTTE